ncbi:DUF2726 domain-containing protein [Geomonas subterranea]|uniref:DUF2726 domain-containing protein n=1 Tax=Geomonas subterranea TaxID=2847989 RepID=A0ABX8LB09_9BACT|nr:DUF2726 domain-containing protein [Geomonas subterranea]QXE89181.1 DUF2726 domain-containing protein [Geomonas subterranea]QXM08704.1 DUF2726 domain-containing protein [Geomonas subterranea]
MNLAVLIVILVLIAVLAALKAKSPSKDDRLSFASRETLFSPAERSFLGVLDQALDRRYRVFGKVRLGDLVKPAKGLSKGKCTTALNKVNQKHVDFVVCSAMDLAVVGVVELDDQSHGREDRAGRDAFVDHVLSDAGIPISRFSAKRGYQIQEVRAKLVETFKLAVTSPTVATVQDSAPPQPRSITLTGPTLATASPETKDASPICEKCGTDMVRRQSKNGLHAGKFFWACSTFPKCRQVVPITEE